MDIEQRFLSALLLAKRSDQDVFYSQQMPKGIFRLREREVDWVYKFRERSGAYPSIKLFNVKFPDSRLLRHSDSVSACLEPVVNMAMFAQMRDLTAETKEYLDKTDNIAGAMELFKQKAMLLNNYSPTMNDIHAGNTKVPLTLYRENIRRQVEEPKSIIDTPWKTINKLVKFYVGGDTVILAARTSMGKTWYAIEWANYLASKQVPCVFFSKEMTKEVIASRLEAKRFKLPYEDLRAGSLAPKVLRQWHKARRYSNAHPDSYPLWVIDNREFRGMAQISQKIIQYKPQVAFIDGAYMLQPEGASAKTQERERYALISSQCKMIATNTNTVVVMVLQTNREAESKPGETLGGLIRIHGADAWAQDATGVYILSGKRGSNRRELELAKSRESSIGTIHTKFQLEPYPIFDEASGSGLSLAADKSRQSKPTFIKAN